MTTYKLRRAGQFTVKTTGEFHCGTTDTLDIKYTFTVHATGDSLDNRGFLFDQVHIDNWFKAQTTTALSCEAYTTWCARQLYRLCRSENDHLTIAHLELALSPAPYAAEITFEFNPDKPHSNATHSAFGKYQYVSQLTA